MRLTGDSLEDLFTLKVEIKKWDENEKIIEKNTKEDVLISLRVNIPRDNDSISYFLIPLKRVYILSFLNNFKNDNQEKLDDFAETMLMSDMVFISRLIYLLTKDNKITKLLKKMLNLPSFEKREEAIVSFCDNYLVKSMSEICENIDMKKDDFLDEQMEYAHQTGLYNLYIEAVSSTINLVHAQSLYKENNFLATTIENTFKEAVIYLKNINLLGYEEAIGKKILVDDMIDSVKTLQDIFIGLTDKDKALGQLKIRNHPISFILDDRIVKSKHNKINIFENLCIGIINASVSINIAKQLSKNDKEKFESHLRVLKQYNVDENKLLLVEDLIYLCDSIKYIKHIPTIAISNAYHALSEKQTYKLSKFLLPSISKDTVSKHYKNIHYIDIYEQISFE